MKNKITAITLATILSLSATSGPSHATRWTFGENLGDAGAWCDTLALIFTFGQVDSC